MNKTSFGEISLPLTNCVTILAHPPPPHIHKHTLSHTHTHSLSLSHTHTHSLSLSFSLSLKHTHTHTHTHTLSLSLSLSHTHTLSLSLTHTHTHTHTHSLSLSPLQRRTIPRNASVKHGQEHLPQLPTRFGSSSQLPGHALPEQGHGGEKVHPHGDAGSQTTVPGPFLGSGTGPESYAGEP